MRELLLLFFRGLQPHQQDWTGTILTLMEQSRGFILRQILDARFQHDIGVLAVGEADGRALTGLVQHALQRTGDLRRLVVVGAREHSLLVHGQFEHGL